MFARVFDLLARNARRPRVPPRSPRPQQARRRLKIEQLEPRIALTTYHITDVNGLQAMENDLAGTYILDNDIDASATKDWGAYGNGFVPVGSAIDLDTGVEHPFTGKFYGQGHVITGLHSYAFNYRPGGLFGFVAHGAVISDVGLVDEYVDAYWWCGGLVGCLEDNSTVSNCYADGCVTAIGTAGGLVGFMDHSTVTISYANGLAYAGSSDTIGTAGGLVGYMLDSTVSYSYAAAIVYVLEGGRCGGLVGDAEGSTVSNSYWDVDKSDQDTSAGGIGKTTVEMKQQATFVGWDFKKIWRIDNEGINGINMGYPYLFGHQGVEPVVTIQTVSAASEDGDVGEFVVHRSGGATSQDCVVSYTVSGTAVSDTEYETLSGSVTIPAGSDSASIIITPRDDSEPEEDKTVIVTLTGTSDASTVGDPDTATLTIRDNDPRVEILATDPDAAEKGQDPGVFTITRSGGTSYDLLVSYQIGGTATNGVDYAKLSGTITIAAGTTSNTVVIAPKDDKLIEGPETVVLTISPSEDYTVGSSNSATVTIADNDVPDLAATFGAVTLSDTIVPGDKGKVSVIVQNQGTGKAIGKIAIQIYASTDGVIDSGDILLATLVNQSVNLLPNGSAKYTANVVIPSNALSGNYYLLARIDANNAIPETDETNNLATTPTARELVWKFGTFDGRKNVALSVNDAENTLVKFSMTGAGWGEVIGGEDFTSINIHGTTASSSVTIATSGTRGTAIHDFNSDLALGGVTAKTTSLLGTMSIGGGIGKLTLSSVWAGATLIVHGGLTSFTAGNLGDNVALTVDATLGKFSASSVGTGSKISAGADITSLATTHGGLAATVTAGGAIGTVSVKGGSFVGGVSANGALGVKSVTITGGGFEGDIAVPNGTVGSLTVTGAAPGSRLSGAWQALAFTTIKTTLANLVDCQITANTIGTMTAGGMSGNSSIQVGSISKRITIQGDLASESDYAIDVTGSLGAKAKIDINGTAAYGAGLGKNRIKIGTGAGDVLAGQILVGTGKATRNGAFGDVVIVDSLGSTGKLIADTSGPGTLFASRPEKITYRRGNTSSHAYDLLFGSIALP